MEGNLKNDSTEENTKDLNESDIKKEEENPTETPSTLSSKSQEIFNKMSEGAKKIANEAYKSIGVGVDRVVDKMKIVWNQFGIDGHQRAATKFNSQMDGFDSRIGKLDQVKKELESDIENLKQSEFLGVDPSSLQLQIEKIEQQKIKLQGDKSKTQLEFEGREKKIQTCTNERDSAANRFIERYEEKLKPMEEVLKGLETSRGQVNFSIKRTEIKHKEELADLDKLEKQRNGIADNLRRARMSSEKKIRKDETIKQLDKQLRDRREAMRVEKGNLAKRKVEIDRDIARVDAKANPCRDKRERFVRIKEGRPIENVSTREAVPAENQDSDETKKETKKSAEVNEQLTVTHIDNWNKFLKEKYKEGAEELDKEDFLKEADLSKMDIGDFKDLLGEYLKYKGKSMEQFNKSINEFIKGKEEVKSDTENEDGNKNPDSDETEEEAEKNNEQLAATYIDNWNGFLKNKYKNIATLLDEEDFLERTYLSKDEKINFEKFKKRLGKYLEYRGRPMEQHQFDKNIDKFEEKVRGKKKA